MRSCLAPWPVAKFILSATAFSGHNKLGDGKWKKKKNRKMTGDIDATTLALVLAVVQCRHPGAGAGSGATVPPPWCWRHCAATLALVRAVAPPT